jgi:pre-rRNA-processing protein TSR1
MEHSMNTRLFSGMNAIPKNVLVVGLCPDYQKDLFLTSVFDCMEQEYKNEFQNILDCERFKQRLNFITPNRNILSILNALKISDLVVFVLSSTEEVDEFGEKIMSVMKIQGIPNVTTCVQYLAGYPQKKQLEIRKSLNYYMNHHFPGDYKLYSDEKNESLNLLRYFETKKILDYPVTKRDSMEGKASIFIG